MNPNRVVACLLSLLCTTGLFAQQFGGNPPSLHFSQINTDTARIIFPAGLESQAQQIAAIVHQLSRTTLPTIGGHQQKINIVLQNQTIIPNGYVGLAPFRSEFQLTPEQNSFELGSLPWPKMLAIHEYRHVQQYDNFRVGLSGAMYYLFGEGGQALANSLAVPNWFWEGDAVYQETLVSDQGRGRLPYFFNGYRSMWAAGKHYSWMKLRNGSLRDYVPDHYPVGYMLVAYGRQQYGDEFWRQVSRDAAAFRGLFYPMQRAITKYTGTSFGQFRNDALTHFLGSYGPGFTGPVDKAGKLAGDKDLDRAGVDYFASVHRHFAANEEFPQFIGHDSILYMRSTYKRIPAFYIRNLRSGQETKLRARAISLDNYFSYRGGKAVYAAYETDPRWGWRDYGVIRVFDPSTGEDHRITSQSRYFSPDISPDGNHIVVVQEAADGSCELRILNGSTGSPEKIIPNRDSLFYTYPKFYAGDKILSAVRNNKGQMALALVGTRDGEVDYLTSFTYQTLGMPSVKQDTIWFTASRNGQDRVYGLDGQQRGNLFRVRLPHGDPAAGQYAFQAGNDGQYAWSGFTAVGYIMDTIAGGHLELEPIARDQWDQSLPVQGIDSLNKGAAHLLDRIGINSHPVTNYPASFHLINIHSWRPYVNDPDYTFSLVSENILNTLQSQLSATYNRNEGYTQVGLDATYGALYPYIDAGVDYIFNRNAFSGYGKKVYWNEGQVYGGLSVPLNFTHGRSYTSLQVGSDIVYKREYFQGAYKDSFPFRGLAFVDPYISFTHQIQQTPQQINPRWAQTLYASYDRTVTSISGHQFLASAYFYLPGIYFTHSLVLGAAFQQRDLTGAGGFSNSFPFSRGYSAENFYRMYRFSGNYHFPLLYPDWGLGNIVFFQRIRANCYYDYTKVLDYYTNGRPFNALYRSYGSEVYFDTKWWNQLSISFGIRYSRLIDPDFEGRGPNQWELILPLNLLSQGYSAKKPVYAY